MKLMEMGPGIGEWKRWMESFFSFQIDWGLLSCTYSRVLPPWRWNGNLSSRDQKSDDFLFSVRTQAQKDFHELIIRHRFNENSWQAYPCAAFAKALLPMREERDHCRRPHFLLLSVGITREGVDKISFVCQTKLKLTGLRILLVHPSLLGRNGRRF